MLEDIFFLKAPSVWPGYKLDTIFSIEENWGGIGKEKFFSQLLFAEFLNSAGSKYLYIYTFHTFILKRKNYTGMRARIQQIIALKLCVALTCNVIGRLASSMFLLNVGTRSICDILCRVLISLGSLSAERKRFGVKILPTRQMHS